MSKTKKKDKELKQKRVIKLVKKGIKSSGKVKRKCCKKFKKAESKRCKRCPCFDLVKKRLFRDI